MKKNFSFYDALFFFFLFFKAKHWPFFDGGVPSWIVVFSPYLLESLLVVLNSLAKFFTVKERIHFLLWKTILRFKMNKAGRQAAKEMFAAFENGRNAANPGGFKDPSNFGK